MIRLVIFLLGVLAIAAGLHWLADRPGTIVVEFQVEKHDVVYPMVPSGATLNEMIRRPATTPEMV